MTLPVNIALQTKSTKVSFDDLSVVAGALQKQLVRDFAPLWGITGTVAAYPLDRAPIDYWKIIVQDELDEPNAAGYHDDENGQPYSLVMADDDWTVTASHELLEMAADPFGSRFVAGWHDFKRVNYLIEVADPCEEVVYTINDVRVSDFVCPAYFAPAETQGARYSYSGRINGPKQLKPGGYISWLDVEANEWSQRDFFGDHPVVTNLGRLTMKNGNCRSTIDALTRKRKAKINEETKVSQSTRGQISTDV